MAQVTTNSRSRRWWILAGIAGLAVAATWALTGRSRRPALPANQHYASLPEAFNQALQVARQRILSGGNDPANVEKLARLYQANRLYPEAETCYRLIAATSSGLTVQDHYYLAQIALDDGDLPEAKTELRTVITNAPHYLPAHLALAEALFKSGQDAEAGREDEAVLAIAPEQPQALFGLARIALQHGDDDAAVARLEDLMASHPESTSGAALFAEVLERRGESDRAVAMTEWSRQKPEPIPADPWLTALLADCYDLQRLGLKFEDYFKTGQIGEAMPLLRRLEELDPRSPVPALLRGWSAAQSHQDEAAVTEYTEALARGGDPEKICPYLVQALLAVGKVTEAANLMAGYYARSPDSIPILTAYADVAVRQQDGRLSRELLTKVLQKEPYLYSANVNLGRILWAAGERDAAAKCLQRIATVYAHDVPSRALLGEYYLGKSEPRAALAPLEQALAQSQSDPALREKLATMLDAAYLQTAGRDASDGKWSPAADFFEQAMQLRPAEPSAYAGAADARTQLKQFHRAADVLEKLAALQPDNPTIYLSLGDVRYQDGDSTLARRDWEKALQLAGTGDAALREAIEQRLSGHISAETFR